MALARAPEADMAVNPLNTNVAEQRTQSAPRFAMSVDVEDYFQVWAFSGVIDRDRWDGFQMRVGSSTRRLLDLFDAANAKATFFILGWVGERAPELVREITDRGHEAASHGYDHRKVFDLTPAEFRADVVKTKNILEDATGASVRGFRAAGFSIDERTPWAYEILRETGHLYSSSSHPIAHDHYGDPEGPRDPRHIDEIIEAPVATAEFMGRRVSCAGGGWFRASPYLISRSMINRAARTLSGPIIFYCHPWEIDANQPRISSAPVKSKARHYLNLSSTESKLKRLLADFSWGRVDHALGLD